MAGLSLGGQNALLLLAARLVVAGLRVALILLRRRLRAGRCGSLRRRGLLSFVGHYFIPFEKAKKHFLVLFIDGERANEYKTTAGNYYRSTSCDN
jgi:hypothetical protein